MALNPVPGILYPQRRSLLSVLVLTTRYMRLELAQKDRNSDLDKPVRFALCDQNVQSDWGSFWGHLCSWLSPWGSREPRIPCLACGTFITPIVSSAWCFADMPPALPLCCWSHLPPLLGPLSVLLQASALLSENPPHVVPNDPQAVPVTLSEVQSVFSLF